ncbi:MAG: ATP-binding cassette domain-containing protein [Bacilli bacterium]|nr:ATP-binding cassette domain-containing protein [Bacilli bacterium]
MLELKNISKTYQTGTFRQTALNNVSLKFRKNEFVSILGASGSGKTTLLNIIGGLDHYDEGDLIINNKSTKKFKNHDWDSYRNNCIGFIFQSYNLIGHISVLDNVEMGMTLSGISAKKRKEKAKEALKRVGLEDHMHKRPNQLSGGQMQRVAIARALANDPDVILADEPTGALDTKTSIQIMDLIKEIAKDKLVIMVTHNPDLAKEYANRIIELKDGEVINDSNPIKKDEKDDKKLKIKKTAMSFFTALKLSFNNIRTKKGRTLITAFASSIGIIGIALILSLSNGFKIEIDKFEKQSLSKSPIIISSISMSSDTSTYSSVGSGDSSLEKYTKKEKVYAKEDVMESLFHINNINKDYMDYLSGLDMSNVAGVTYDRGTSLILVRKDNKGKYGLMNTTSLMTGETTLTLLPTTPKNQEGVLESMYDVIAGEINYDEPGLVLQVDMRNQIFASTLEQLGFKKTDDVSFNKILGKELRVVFNDDYYMEIDNRFIPNQDYESLYNSENSYTIKVQAIIRGKQDQELITGSGSGLCYNQALADLIIEHNKDSRIVQAQLAADYNILTTSLFDETITKETLLGKLGYESIPTSIYIYPNSFDGKEKITEYLDKYNDGKKDKDQIKYTDMAAMISSLSGNIMDAITIVLIAFSSISLIVSSIMIGIITYISVLERTKEIGILRSLGARAKDIKRVFIAETFIIGLSSGLLGVLIARLLIIPINKVIYNLTSLSGVARMNIKHIVALLLVSTTLTIIGGYIPAKIASKKKPVDSLRSE